MYRSLLVQLLQGFPDLQVVLDTVSDSENACPGTEMLKSLLERSIWALGQRGFTCFIDALDEGDEQQITEMVRFFENLADQAAERKIYLRICFSSRHYPYIDLRHGLRLTLEDELGHTDDLTSYINSHLRLKSPVPVADLHDQLLKRSRGVFLWVVLVVDILNKESYHGGFALMKRLDELPDDLGHLFANMLTRDKDNLHTLRLCIMWILFSKRPLTPSEFYHAMWCGLVTSGLTAEEAPDPLSQRFDLGARLSVINSSKGLAEITASDRPVVQFIHESIRDFLIKDNGLIEIWPDFGEALSHEYLKRSCRFYIEKMGTRSAFEWNIVRSCPLLKYSTQHVLIHAEAAAESFPQDDFLLSFPKESWINLNASFNGYKFRVDENQPYKIRKYKEEARLLYILADGALPNLIRTRMKQNLDNSGLRIEMGRFPFFAAVEKGSLAAVAALLGSSLADLADVDIAGGLDLHSFNTHTPLTWATSLGHFSIVMLLVRQGANVKERGGHNLTPLGTAIRNKRMPLIRLFLHNSQSIMRIKSKEELMVDVSLHADALGHILNMDDKESLDDDNPLCSATVLEQPTIVQILVESGAKVDQRDVDGNTPLDISIAHGYEGTVRVLLKAGIYTSNRHFDWVSPLRLAVGRGDESITRELLEHGADVNTRLASKDISLLHLPIREGEESVTGLFRNPRADHDLSLRALRRRHMYNQILGPQKRLFDQGANIGDEEVSYSGTLLHWAVWYNSVEETKLLIHHKAHINARDTNGFTPLHTASMNQWWRNGEVIRILVESGAELGAVTRLGLTALHLSAWKGHMVMAEILVNHGAEVDSKDGQGRTPLHWAARGFRHPRGGFSVSADSPTRLYRERILAFLISRGAEVNARDYSGLTPIILAAQAGDKSMMRLLIKHGFDENSRSLHGKSAGDVADEEVEESFALSWWITKLFWPLRFW